jgi:hypothetical protein
LRSSLARACAGAGCTPSAVPALDVADPGCGAGGGVVVLQAAVSQRRPATRHAYQAARLADAMLLLRGAAG